jgi:hypothetical protein
MNKSTHDKVFDKSRVHKWNGDKCTLCGIEKKAKRIPIRNGTTDVYSYDNFKTFRLYAGQCDLKKYIESMVMPEPNTGCWFWMGFVTSHGYGKIVFNGRKVAAHRISYAVHKGKIKDGAVICHKCDVPGCVNPDHLFLGTQKDNVHDMIRKGRAKFPIVNKGEASHLAKVSADTVLKIRASNLSNVEASEFFGLPYHLVYQIRKRISWKHI